MVSDDEFIDAIHQTDLIRLALIPALNAPFLNQSLLGRTWKDPKLAEVDHVVTMLELVLIITSPARTGAILSLPHTLQTRSSMCNGASTTMATMVACLPTVSARIRL